MASIDPNLVGSSNEASSEVISNIISGLAPQLAPLMGILQAVGIIFLIYIIILIIKAILNIRTGFKVSKIAKNVEEINQKLDVLTKIKKKK
ncbi:MAG: hypothetical protein Q7S33_01735 [Nanoarchaeota archaeon]|nr:hypothetical protein [Nanoarchaeota archaeon]